MSNTRIIYIKKVPQIVKDWFEAKYKKAEGFTFEFYKYFSEDRTIYGCFVRQHGELYTYAHQGTEQDFKH